MPLNAYQKHILSDIRAEEQIYGIKLWQLSTGAGYSSLDAYRQQTWVETDTVFSGAVLWAPWSGKRDSEGGFYKTSEAVIVANRDNKSVLESQNIKLEFNSIKFRINRIIDCEDTQEIVIYASRLE